MQKTDMKIIIMLGIIYLVMATSVSANNGSNSIFKVQPIIKFITVSDSINKTTDGLIDIYVDNPKENNYTISVDIVIKASPNIQFFSPIFLSNGTKGIGNGAFIVQAGKKKNVGILLRSDKDGEYDVTINGTYYIVGGPNVQTTSYTQKFKVTDYENLQTNNSNISDIGQSNTLNPKKIPDINSAILLGIILISIIKRKMIKRL